MSQRFENQPRMSQPNMLAAAPKTTMTNAPMIKRFGRNLFFSSPVTAGTSGATALTWPSSQSARTRLLTPSG